MNTQNKLMDKLATSPLYNKANKDVNDAEELLRTLANDINYLLSPGVFTPGMEKTYKISRIISEMNTISNKLDGLYKNRESCFNKVLWADE